MGGIAIDVACRACFFGLRGGGGSRSWGSDCSGAAGGGRETGEPVRGAEKCRPFDDGERVFGRLCEEREGFAGVCIGGAGVDSFGAVFRDVGKAISGYGALELFSL